MILSSKKCGFPLILSSKKCTYYWSNANTPAEIDFIVQNGSRILPIEVKAEENVRARSLAQFIKDNPQLKGLRISMKGYVNQEWMENIPLPSIMAYFSK